MNIQDQLDLRLDICNALLEKQDKDPHNIEIYKDIVRNFKHLEFLIKMTTGALATPSH